MTPWPVEDQFQVPSSEQTGSFLYVGCILDTLGPVDDGGSCLYRLFQVYWDTLMSSMTWVCVLLPVTVSKQEHHYFLNKACNLTIIHWAQVCTSDRPYLRLYEKQCLLIMRSMFLTGHCMGPRSLPTEDWSFFDLFWEWKVQGDQVPTRSRVFLHRTGGLSHPQEGGT